jgi:DHA1 family multidrug resistance protein-like MFS transporter
MFAMYFVTQSIFAYIPMIYPRYAASILAASSFARSLIAFAAVLFAEPLFTALGIGAGVSLLGGLTVLCAIGLVFLWKYGKWLRGRSSFAVD